MTVIREVTLEFLRHGPPHNQLLSPLTRYLGLCGNHMAETVLVPFEHEQFMTRLQALRYQEGSEVGKLKFRELLLRETAQAMSGVFSGVAGLIAELSGTLSRQAELIELRLVLSASELALLPFELANAPNGFPGAGQPLTLQNQLPLCITRRVRRVDNPAVDWTAAPRILFVAASPGGVALPLEKHKLALRQAIEPWLRPAADERQERFCLEEHLVELPQASLAAIEEACAANAFTHVHLLAHGVQFPEAANRHRFGLALHHSKDLEKMEYVDGTRLAAALRAYRHGAHHGLATPAVVTLASCDGGQQGSVMGAGASVAHTLHEAGIPLVVASQFPLSFASSVVMAQVLYEGLLWGQDPRLVLSELRRRLKVHDAGRHDWAGIVAYAALPVDLDRQLKKLQVDQGSRSIDAALQHADRALEKVEKNGQLSSEESVTILQRARTKIERAKQQMQHLERPSSDVHGLLAGAEKREAQILYRASRLATPDRQRQEYEQDSRAALVRALEHYRLAFHRRRKGGWAIVQALVLGEVLGRREEDRFFARWTAGRLEAETDLLDKDSRVVAWAHGALIELYLLSVLFPPGWTEIPDRARAQALACDHARQLLRRVGERSFHLYATRRQILRYPNWFCRLPGISLSDHPEIEEIAREVLTILPATSPDHTTGSYSQTERG